MIREDCRYGDWLKAQYWRIAFNEGKYTHVVEADISEFYQRIYHHRLENSVAAATTNQPMARFKGRLLLTLGRGNHLEYRSAETLRASWQKFCSTTLTVR